MKSYFKVSIIAILFLSLVGCGNVKTTAVAKTNQVKTTTTKVFNVSDNNPYIKILGYKKNSDNVIWQVKFLQDTKNVGTVFIYVLGYNKDGKPIKYHKVSTDPVVNSGQDELILIKDKAYPVNETYNFAGNHDILMDYSKLKFCVETVYYLDSNGQWKAWENPNLQNWIKQNKDKY